MASRKGSEIEGALLGKGFRYTDTHHRYLILYENARRTTIRTYVSQGNLEYGDSLLSKVQKQLRLPTKAQLLDLVDCPLSGDDYLDILRGQGLP